MGLKYKVYDHDGEFIASTRHAMHAAMLAGMAPDSEVKYGGHQEWRLIWTEGYETVLASDSYDDAAAIMERRIQEREL